MWIALAIAAPSLAIADPAPFDLAGPVLEVSVTHGGVTLPIGATPNLAVGDQLSIKADLSADQSVPYLLVIAFLRGATNPAPKAWFSRVETWTPAGRAGLKVTVPKGAQQALIFMAPKAGGDFKTLVGAVRGRPGAFVRASQDLNQAFLDRSRLDAFLGAVRAASRRGPQQLATISPLLARSLAIKLNAECLQKTPELQAVCLSKGQDALVLDDGHDISMAQTLTSGEPSDLIERLGASPNAGGGYYSPYIGAVMDIVRLLDSMHTAHYQYIPALALAEGARLSLMLNAAPSFHNPMSVLVTALPSIGSPEPPTLAPLDAKTIYCAEEPNLLLPVDGAPLAFSTGYARNLALRLATIEGEQVDLPARLDASRGGLLVDTAELPDFRLPGELDAALHGDWGFTAFDGPHFRLQTSRSDRWQLAASDQPALIVERSASIQLQGGQAACAKSVMLRAPSAALRSLTWKLAGPDRLTVTLPLKGVEPGPLAVVIQSFGGSQQQSITLRAYAQPGRFEAFNFHSGDASGLLTGGRLDQVASLTLGKVVFSPGQLRTNNGLDSLVLAATDEDGLAHLRAGETTMAKIALRDGRRFDLEVTIGTPRPDALLIRVGSNPSPASSDEAIELTNPAEIPAGSTLTFAIRAQTPEAFAADEQVEVAPTKGVGESVLTFARGLVLEDAHVALARIDTGKALTPSTFGPLRYRILEDGVAGDWRPLATLVRLPTIAAVQCPPEPNPTCQLKGSNLFLIDSVSVDPHFAHAVDVPEGFTADKLRIPRPDAGRVYIKLRDDPGTIDPAVIPVEETRSPRPDMAPTTAVAVARP